MPLNEADTRAILIDPALSACGWSSDMVRREVTQPRVEIDTVTGRARRKGSGRADYLLRCRVNLGAQAVALALIEAKSEALAPTHGLEQAKGYRARHNVPFVFSSNGHQFVEFDAFTGVTSSPRPMAAFPSPADLLARYEAGMGFALASPAAAPLVQPYAGGEGERRYYQDAAIRAVLEKIARCETNGAPRRALLTLATGTGKTFIASKLLRKIADAGQLRRALFLCDRDELRTQGLAALKRDFGADVAIVEQEGRLNKARNARVHVATYQTLGIDTEEGIASFLNTYYPDNAFSHIVIDECHRSAWGRWFEVLERNPDAVQVGLTATPRSIRISETGPAADRDRALLADNIAYFGEPVYAYDIAQAIEDGYLAACEIVRREVFIEDSEVDEQADGLSRDRLDGKSLTYRRTGQVAGADDVEDHYRAQQFETAISLPDRTRRMAEDLFAHLLATGGPDQKTIVFCARDEHADEVSAALNNLHARWCADNGVPVTSAYAFKCTASANGASLIPDFKGAPRSHFIACTVDLLSTGVDVPSLRNVVFFRYMRSPITFYQMIGRGTRIDPATGKLMFRVYDYTDATRLLGEDFASAARRTTEPRTGSDDGPGDGLSGGGGALGAEVIVVGDLALHIEAGGRFILMRRGERDERVPVEEYRSLLAQEVRQQAPDYPAFQQIWIEPARRRRMMDGLISRGFAPRVIQHVDGLFAYDEFDVLAAAAYDRTPRTREDRAERFRLDNGTWFAPMPPDSQAVILALTSAFRLGGTEELETSSVLRTPAVRRAGGLAALAKVGDPAQVLRQTRERLFAT